MALRHEFFSDLREFAVTLRVEAKRAEQCAKQSLEQPPVKNAKACAFLLGR